MLEKLEVVDYQSIKHAELPLGRFTVFVGPSGRGKSSVVRALTSLCFNRAGDSFIRHGRNKTVVTLTLDGGEVVEWEKSKGKGATYGLNDQLFTRTGRDVPEAVSDVLGIRQIDLDKTTSFRPQFHDQFDAPMLMTESSSVAARVLARVTKLQFLSEGKTKCNKDFKRANRKIDAAEDDKERLETEVHGLIKLGPAFKIKKKVKGLLDGVKVVADTAGEAQEIAQDISLALRMVDTPLPSQGTIDAAVEAVELVQKAQRAMYERETAAVLAFNSEDRIIRLEEELVALNLDEIHVIEELGACPLCGSSENWDHEHQAISN